MAQVTKKVDCSAKIYAKRVLLLPKFKISNITPYEKRKMSSSISEHIANIGNSALDGEDTIIYNLPDNSKHSNHFVGKNAGKTESLDIRVREEIKMLARSGKRNVKSIKDIIEHWVKTILKIDNEDLMRRRFDPEPQLVRAIITREKRKLRWSKIDLENTEKMLQDWKNEETDIFFRPYTIFDQSQAISTADETEEEDDSSVLKWKSVPTNNNLLFVYQNQSMKELYKRYGANSVLLDATYKTCKYAIPLYFIVVKTNVCYQVVGTFITQFETTESLSEALTIFKNWNPEVTPKYGMVDFAAEEINALEAVFPEIKVFICAFHREQAWTRWTNKRDNLSVDDVKCVREKLREIAHSPTEDRLQEAIQKLKSWVKYSNSHVQNYFENTWLPEIKRWALPFKPHDLFFDTNNGVERTNEELKYRYLQGYRSCSLSEIIRVVVKDFIPDRYKLYVMDNMKMSSFYRRYGNDIPICLHDRPKWFIDNIMTRYSAAENMNEDETHVEVVNGHTFLVSSESSNNIKYLVEFLEAEAVCTCNCFNYRKSRLICKHILLIGMRYKKFSMQNLMKWVFFSNPIFNIDNDIVQKNLNSDFDTDDRENEGIADWKIELENGNEETERESTNNSTNACASEEKDIRYVTEDDKNRDTNEEPELLVRDLEEAIIKKIESKCETYKRDTKYGKLSLRGSQRKRNIMKFSAEIRTLESLIYLLPNDKISEVTEGLQKLNDHYKQHITTDNGFPVEPENTCKEDINSNENKDYGKLKVHRKKGVGGRVGVTADMIKESPIISVDDDKENKPEHVILEDIFNNQDTWDNFTEESNHETIDGLADPKKESYLATNFTTTEEKENRLVLVDCLNSDQINTHQNQNYTSGIEIRTLHVSEVNQKGSKRKLSSDSQQFKKRDNSLSRSINSECLPYVKLSDIIINHAQCIIAKQERRSGFQDTLLGRLLKFKQNRDCIQILHNGADHWITVRILNHERVERVVCRDCKSPVQ